MLSSRVALVSDAAPCVWDELYGTVDCAVYELSAPLDEERCCASLSRLFSA
jgi:hypothetical protein